MGCCESTGDSRQTQPEDVVEPRKIASLMSQPEPHILAEIHHPSVAERHLTDWVRLGGAELEEALRNEWVKLLRADWLVQYAEGGGILKRRQEMPPAAYIDLDELKQAGAASAFTNHLGRKEECLRVIVLSHPWLHPEHPDPHGENVRLLAMVLKHFVDSDEGRPFGVLIDFTALFQRPRTAEEEEVFMRSLPTLNTFFSHPETVVFKLTQLPDDYPHHTAFRYELPERANTAAYGERGWCFAESSMSALVKFSGKVLTLSRDSGDLPSLQQVISRCKSGRDVPLSPDDFNKELSRKAFTNKKADFDRVAHLYATAFEHCLGSATELDFSGVAWGGPEDLQRLFRVLHTNNLLRTLKLGRSYMKDPGAAALAKSIATHSSLQTLTLAMNSVQDEGAVALGKALESNRALTRLDLTNNLVGDEGAVALGKALQGNRYLTALDLTGNFVGDQGAAALGQALQHNGSLRQLVLEDNVVEDEGAMALAEALKKNSALHTLSLRSHRRAIGSHTCDALREVARARLTPVNISLNQPA